MTTMSLSYSLRELCAELDISPDIEYVTNATDAEAVIERPDNIDLILLDDRMPPNDVGTLERDDFDAFCDVLGNYGYAMLPQIKSSHPETVVIGTSSSRTSTHAGVPESLVPCASKGMKSSLKGLVVSSERS